MDGYYVYRHIRVDSNAPFYVGKGKGNRSRLRRNRNKYWTHIANKYGYEIEIIMDNLTEKEAFAKETEFIKLYKSLGYCEANMTDGGEGSSNPNDETRKKMSDSHKGRQYSDETKLKMSIAAKKRVYSKELREKMSDSHKGKKHSDETKLKMSKLKKGKSPWNKGKTGVYSEETLKKMSDSHKN